MIEKIKGSSFLKNTLLLVSGTTLAQAIPMLISPWLTRLYSPESFGLLSVYVSYISIIGVLASGRYEKAIIIPQNDNEGKKLMLISQLTVLFFCISLSIVNLVIGKQVLNFFHAQELMPYSWLIIIGVLLLASDQSYYHWANRIGAFKRMSLSKISGNLSSGFFSILFGVLHWEAMGLLISKVLGLLASTMTNLNTFSSTNFKDIHLDSLKKTAWSYIKFPIYIMPGHLMNAIALNGPPILLALYYSESEVGFFALTQRVVMLPVSIIARSVGDVFRQRATVQFNATGNFRALYLKTFLALSLMGSIPFLVLWFFAPYLFSLVFGSDWATSGSYAQILSILFFLQFVTSPLSNVFIIAGKQKLEFFWQILFLLSSVLPIVLGYYFFDNMYQTLIAFAIARASTYLLSLFLTLPLTHKK